MIINEVLELSKFKNCVHIIDSFIKSMDIKYTNHIYNQTLVFNNTLF